MGKEESTAIIPIKSIEGIIYFIRSQKVMLDRDLAMLYEVETKKLIQSVKRNSERFPDDFMFQLTKEELENWRSQFVTSNLSSKMGLRRCPYAFTEQGVAMLSSVLHSPQAVKVNIEIMRTFIKLRHTLISNKELTGEVKALKEFVLKNSFKTDREFKRVWNAIDKLSEPPKEEVQKIGFKLTPKSS